MVENELKLSEKRVAHTFCCNVTLKYNKMPIRINVNAL